MFCRSDFSHGDVQAARARPLKDRKRQTTAFERKPQSSIHIPLDRLMLLFIHNEEKQKESCSPSSDTHKRETKKTLPLVDPCHRDTKNNPLARPAVLLLLEKPRHAGPRRAWPAGGLKAFSFLGRGVLGIAAAVVVIGGAIAVL